MKKNKILISCFYNSYVNSLPIGFSWTKTLLQKFPNKYNVTILLHGECLQFGLKDKNPFVELLKYFYESGVRIKICNYCLEQDGYKDAELLNFVKPVTFSVDYIAMRQLDDDTAIIYDAQL